MAIRFMGGEGSLESDIAALVKRAKRPHDLHAEYLTLYGDLIESRIKSVRRHRAPGRHGGEMGRWFVEADWPSDGTLPTGRAAARAFDPFSNARIDGYVVDRLSGAHLPVPPLQWGGVVYQDKEPELAVEAPVEQSNRPVEESNKAPAEESNSPADEALLDSNSAPLDSPEAAPLDSAFDRKMYQRELMRERRAAEKAGREQLAVGARGDLPANVVPLVPHDLAVRRPVVGVPELVRRVV